MIKRCGEKRPTCPDSGAGWPISWNQKRAV